MGHKMRKKILASALGALLAIASLTGTPANATGHGGSRNHVSVAPGGSLHHVNTGFGLLSGSGYYYARGYENFDTSGKTVQGIFDNFLVAKPYIQCTAGEHSLIEASLQDTTGHAVEIGWTVGGCTGGVPDPPKLFASVWTNTNTWAGCYFEGCGWVDWTPTNSADDLGRDLSSVANATFPSNVKKFGVQYVTGTNVCGTASSGWGFYYDNLGVGCYPSTVFTGTFTTATVTQSFGEVYYAGSTLPCSDMMNGKKGSSFNGLPIDATDPGYIGSVSYVNPQPTTFSPSLTLDQSDSNAYDAYSIGSTGNRTFVLGGAGYNSTGGTPGNIGSC